MNNNEAPYFETLERAMGEFNDHGVVRNTQCEVCGSTIEILPKGDSVLLVECQCGVYNDTIRGF